MNPSDLPMGYRDEWVKLVTVHLPVDASVMAGVLGANGYGTPLPGGYYPPLTREVRLQGNDVEIWERRIIPPGNKAVPGSVQMSRNPGGVLVENGG